MAFSSGTGCRGSRRPASASRSARCTARVRRAPGRADGRWPRRPSSGATEANAERVCLVRSARTSRTRVCASCSRWRGGAARGRSRRLRGVVRARRPFGGPDLEPRERVRRRRRTPDARAHGTGRRWCAASASSASSSTSPTPPSRPGGRAGRGGAVLGHARGLPGGVRHPRNLADWQLEALAERGGVVGMMALAFTVDPESPTFPAGSSTWTTRSPMADAHVGLGADIIDQVAAEQEFGLEAAAACRTVDARGRARPACAGGFHGPGGYPALVARSRAAATTATGSRRS